MRWSDVLRTGLSTSSASSSTSCPGVGKGLGGPSSIGIVPLQAEDVCDRVGGGVVAVPVVDVHVPGVGKVREGEGGSYGKHLSRVDVAYVKRQRRLTVVYIYIAIRPLVSA